MFVLWKCMGYSWLSCWRSTLAVDVLAQPCIASVALGFGEHEVFLALNDS